jgi:DNA-binding XRE family transcriptional regulator
MSDLFESIKRGLEEAVAHRKWEKTGVRPEAAETSPVSADEFFARNFPGQSRPAVHLKGLRTREGLTQAQLAEATGIHQRHISEMENGKRGIGKETALKLAEALNADYRLFL